MQRDILADGRAVITYPSITPQEDTVAENLRIGSLGGAPEVEFGSIHGIEVGGDGRIYVLDSQASEVRVYGPGGRYESTLTKAGTGPGEIGEANGFSLGPDETLWINDHGKQVLTGIGLDASRLVQHPRFVRSYTAVWNGRVTDDGRLWEQTSPAEAPGEMIAIGEMTLQRSAYYKSFDPRTQKLDSTSAWVQTIRVYQDEYRGFPMQVPIPFTAPSLATMDRNGRIWTADTDRYSVAQLSAAGDTVLTIRIDHEPLPVTSSDLESWKTSMVPFFERFPATMAAVEQLASPTKPMLAQLVTDDQGRLWVGRSVELQDRPLYDVFDSEGTFLGTVRLFERMASYLPPTIRQGRVYAVVLGELDEQYVVRADLPDLRPR